MFDNHKTVVRILIITLRYIYIYFLNISHMSNSSFKCKCDIKYYNVIIYIIYMYKQTVVQNHLFIQEMKAFLSVHLLLN